jgi:hypothetical protein
MLGGMSSQLSAYLESRSFSRLCAEAAEGGLPSAQLVNIIGRNADIDTSAEDVTDGGGDYVFPTAARVHAIVSSSVEDGDDANAATGTVTYGTVVDTETITIDGTTFTKAAAGSATEFSTIAQLTALINALPNVNATDNGTVITITAAIAGTAGNSITMAETSTVGLSLSGATLSGGDAANTTGVLSVRVTGVDADYNELVEDVTLGGTVAVNTVGSFLRINKIETLTVGSNGSAVGNITATAATDSTVSARILAGNNQSFNAVYTVPNNKTAFLLSMSCSLPNATSLSGMATLLSKTAALAGWVTRHIMGVTAAGVPDNVRQFGGTVVFPETSDVKIRVATSGSNADVVAGLQLLVLADAA